MAKTKVGNVQQLTTVAIYVFLIGALGTYFLPVVSVTLPALGKKSWSVRDVVSVIPMPKGGPSKGTAQKEAGKEQLKLDYDFLDLVKEVSPKNPRTKTASKTSPEFIAGALVPVSLALAYLLALLSLFLAPLKKGGTFIPVSLLTSACSAYALLGTYFLAQSAKRAFASSIAKVEDSPFGAIAKHFVQQVTIQPERGLYALVVLTVLALGVGFYRRVRS